MKSLLIVFTTVIIFSANAQTERIIFKAPLLYPEGVAYNPSNRLFYVSSVKTGSIGTVDPGGKYSLFYRDSLLRSSFGMKVNPAGDRLWVCVSDPTFSKYSSPATFKKMARLISLDIGTGKKVADIDLARLYPGKHFANDLSLDDAGNIYVTDSYSPVIYKINASGKASVFTTSELFKSEDVGLNGIAWHPGGFLLVAHNTDGILFKIDAKEPKKISKVKLNTFFPGADGLLWQDNNNLVLIQNKGVNKAFRLSSNDNWQSATINAATLAEDRFQNPTTGAIQENKIWLLNAKLNELSDSTMAPSREFSIQAVRFVPVE
jgi:DNA-binding beta-propeller fold protein YncE